MDAIPEPTPEQSDLSSQAGQAKSAADEPTIEEIGSWDENKLLEWIQQNYRFILKGDNLENFKKACIGGIAFLDSDVEFYETCRLPRGVGLALKRLADKVKEEGKFIPRT